MSMGELAAEAAEESHSLLCHLDGFPHLKVCRSVQERQKCKGIFNDYKTMSYSSGP